MAEVRNYNKCPLKKRPVHYVEPVAIEEVFSEPEQEEPVNLCIKNVIKEEKIVSPLNLKCNRSTPLKEITSNYQQEQIYRASKREEEEDYLPRIVSSTKQEALYNLLPGYAANTTNSLNFTHPPVQQTLTQNIRQDAGYWSYSSREPSLSPPSHSHLYMKSDPASPPPISPPTQSKPVHTLHHYQPEEYYHTENSLKVESHYLNKNRYVPYHVSRQHHVMDQFHHNSMSPTHSHSSLNSLGSPRSSMSPASTSSSLPDDPYHMLPTSINKPVTYETTTNSSNHMVSLKPEMPRYQCPDCSKSYSTYSGLTKHKQFHCTMSATSQAKKSFDCSYCPKTYTSLGALKMHIRTHTKPCKCHICGKAFSRPWLLQGHIRTHTGDKPFSCQYCHRAFADKSNLRAHLQTHSDVKKYSCASCSKTFSRMSLLTKHLEGGCPGIVEHQSI